MFENSSVRSVYENAQLHKDSEVRGINKIFYNTVYFFDRTLYAGAELAGHVLLQNRLRCL